MTGDDGQLSGERLPLWMPLTMAVVGLLGAVLASQVAVAASDDLSADTTADTAETEDTAGLADRVNGPSTTARSIQGDEASTETTERPGLDDSPSPSSASSSSSLPTSSDIDCPPVFVVFFPVGSAQPLLDEGIESDELASWMRRNDDAQLFLNGHADAAGSEQANLQLSFRRAEAAADVLVEAGIAPGRLQPRGFGEYQPVAGVAPDSERNRRVTVEVVDLVGCPTGDDKDVSE